MHTLLKREKSWGNGVIHRVTPKATSSLFADIFAMDALERKNWGRRKKREGLCVSVGWGGGGGVWWIGPSPVTFLGDAAVRGC